MRKAIVTAISSLVFMGVASLAMGASAGDIIITEWQANPAAVGDGSGEYLEVYNTTGSAIDIDGWVLLDDGSDTHTINNGGALNVPAGGFLVMGNDGNSGTNGGYTSDYTYSQPWFLGNSGDEIVLKEGATEICRANYTNGDPGGSGVSEELKDTSGHGTGVTGQNGDPGGPLSDYSSATSSYGDGDLGSPGSAGGTVPVELSGFSID